MKKVLEEIQKLIDEDYPCDNTEQKIGYQYALYRVYNLLSLMELRKEEEPWVDIFKVLRDRKKQNVSEDLEKEIKTWIPAHVVGGDEAPWKELKDVVIQWAGIVARHFYILGLKNNIPVTQITLDELAKEGELVSKDLEEAAEEYCIKCNYGLDSLESDTAIDAFKAGAKWQEKQMPMPEDTVIFQKGIEEGKRLMMEDAVEGEVCKDHIVTEKPFYFYQSRLIELPDNLKEGDKVKIVIVKED